MAASNKKKSNRSSRNDLSTSTTTALRTAVNNINSQGATPCLLGGCLTVGCNNPGCIHSSSPPFTFASPPDSNPLINRNASNHTETAEFSDLAAPAEQIGGDRFPMTAENETIRINRSATQPDGPLQGVNAQSIARIEQLFSMMGEAHPCPTNRGQENAVTSNLQSSGGTSNFSIPFAFQNTASQTTTSNITDTTTNSNKTTTSSNNTSPVQSAVSVFVGLTTTPSLKALTAAAQQSSGTSDNSFLSSVIKPDGSPILFHPGAKNTGSEKEKGSSSSKIKGSGGGAGKDRSICTLGASTGSSSTTMGSSKQKLRNTPSSMGSNKKQQSSASQSFQLSGSALNTNKRSDTQPKKDVQEDMVPPSFLFSPNTSTEVNTPSPAALSLLTQEEQEEALLKAAQQQHQQLLQIQQQQQQALQMMMMQLMMQQQQQQGTDQTWDMGGNLNDWSQALANASGMMNYAGNDRTHHTNYTLDSAIAETTDEALDLARKLREKLTASNSSCSSKGSSSSNIASKTNEYLMNAAAMMGAASNGGCTGNSSAFAAPQQPPNLPYSGLNTVPNNMMNATADVNVSINMLLNWLHSSHDKPAAQTEALWALTNVAGLAPPNVCAGLSGSAAAAVTAGGCDSSSSPVESLTPQLQALLQQQQAQLQQYQQSLAAMSAAASSLSNSAMNSVLHQNELAVNSAFVDAYNHHSLDDLSKNLYDQDTDADDLDDSYAQVGDGIGTPVVNNAALSNFLEQAALSGVNLDPATLAAAVQLCTTTTSPASATPASADSTNPSPHVAALMNWTGTASAYLPPQDNASAGGGGSNSNSAANAFSSSTTSSGYVSNITTGYNPSHLSSTLAAAISASSAALPPSYTNSVIGNSSTTNSNSTLIQTLSTAANLTNSFGGGTSVASAAGAAANLMSNTSATSSYANSNTNILLTHADAIPTLISLLKSPHRQVHEQAMWILGSIVVGTTHSNMNAVYGAAAAANNNPDGNANNPPPSPSATQSQAAASAAAREAVLAAGILEPLCSCLNENAWNISLQRIGSWLLSNLVIPTTNNNNGGANGNNDEKDGNNDDTSLLSNNNGDASILDDVATSMAGTGSGKGGKKDRNKNDITSNDGPIDGLPSTLDVDAILPTLRRLLFSGDADVLSHTCWALSHLCDGPSSHIAAVVCDSGGEMPMSDTRSGAGAVTIPQRLVELLLHPSWRVTKPALRTIGNIVCAECTDANKEGGNANSGGSTGDGTLAHSLIPKLSTSSPPLQDYTEIVLQCGAVPHLKTLISHCNKEIQKEACWTLSNIAAGTVSQIQAVMDCGAIPPLVILASDPETDHEVRSEACWVVLNATSCGSDEQVEQLVADGCVNVLGVLLKEASMVMMALEGLERVLQVEEAREKSRALLGDDDLASGGKNKKGKVKKPSPTDFSSVGSVVNANLIESLEHHKNSAVAKRAQRIWKQHFVCCALCRQYYSRHRESEAKFCNECKCHVCSSCNCEVYHLSYQEELWATEEKDQAGKASKSKKKKQKKKDKEKKKQQAKKETPPIPPKEGVVSIPEESGLANNSKKKTTKPTAAENNSSRKGGQASTLEEDDSINHTSSVSSKSENGSLNFKPLPKAEVQKKVNADTPAQAVMASKNATKKSTTTAKLDQLVPSGIDANSILEEDGDSIDFVLYLQQTGSIIALSKLMDALDYDKDEDDEVDLVRMNFVSKEISL